MLKEILIYLSAYIGLVAFIFYTLGFRERLKRKKPELNLLNLPKVSLIVPAWNEEKGLAHTIQSLLNADYPKDKMEIIVVDDGSTDNTYKIAQTFERQNNPVIKVFTKQNGGKGTALNFGIKQSTGEIIFTMDADSILLPDCIKKQVAYFNNSQVMCVAPIVAVYKPKSIWQRVQQIEYMLGIFIREAFASYNAMHITPGAFSAYRRTFFKKHGLFSVNNLTEDLEMSLRVQYHNYIVETSDAVVYTHSPKNFVSLLKQRRRWYSGLIHNLAHYSALFSRNYGALGLVVLPVALFAILFSIILTMYAVVSAVIDVKKQYVYLQSINFDFMSTLSFTKSTFERYIFESLSNPVVLFLIFFILLSLGYLLFAKTKIKEHSNIAIGLPLFMIFYAMLFAFWWSVSFVYAIFKKSVSWR